MHLTVQSVLPIRMGSGGFEGTLGFISHQSLDLNQRPRPAQQKSRRRFLGKIKAHYHAQLYEASHVGTRRACCRDAARLRAFTYICGVRRKLVAQTKPRTPLMAAKKTSNQRRLLSLPPAPRPARGGFRLSASLLRHPRQRRQGCRSGRRRQGRTITVILYARLVRQIGSPSYPACPLLSSTAPRGCPCAGGGSRPVACRCGALYVFPGLR